MLQCESGGRNGWTHRRSIDIFVIGGGINGCGIARDAAGRGYSVFLAEMNDLASGTSSASTKLIHGGLRYLEHYEFRLVREALMEREVLWRNAPHIIWPLRFVLPLSPRACGRPGCSGSACSSTTISAAASCCRRPRTLDMTQRSGRQAAEAAVHQGLRIFRLLGQRCAAGRAQRPRRRRPRRRHPHPRRRSSARAAKAAIWTVDASRIADTAHVEEVKARLLVNAAGPWVDQVLSGAVGQNDVHNVRLVQGSHIVVPKKFDDPRAYFFQNTDGRIIFAIPYEDDFTLIGTTDQDYAGDPARGEDQRRRDRLSLRRGQRIFRRAGQAATTSSGPIPACARSTTTAPRRRRKRRATMC